ncbi:MAG TPA: hypothetical protein VF552_15665 [Allosphingosinicella sp.]|jgi:hypothetical protein
MAMLALAAALLLQAAQPAPAATGPASGQAASAPAPPATPSAIPPGESTRDVTVIERASEEREEVPLASRIARSVADNAAADPAAAMYLREWSDCIVRIHRPRALALLETPLNSAEQGRIIDQLTGHRFTRRTICARFRYMRIDNLVLRGAVAEALWRWEDRRGRSAGPIAVSAAAAAAAAQNAADRPALLAQLGRCLVERDPQATGRVMATRAGTRASREALAALQPRFAACAPAGLPTRDLHPLAVRGALGEPYYLKMRAASAAPQPAAPATPSTS